MKSIGVDIGTYSVKVAEVETSGKSFFIRSLAEYPLNPDPHFDNQINILEILRKIADNRDFAATTFVFGISQDRVTTRHKFFPFRERSKINKILPFELEDEVPFDMSNAIFDSKIIKFAGNIAEVIACAAPKSKVEAILHMAHDAGIEPQIISMDSSAIANTLENWDKAPSQEEALPEQNETALKSPPTGSNIVLYVGHNKTIVSLFKNQQLYGTRTIIWGGRNLIETVGKKYGVLYPEALREVQSKAFVLLNSEGASRDQVMFSDTIIEAYSEMVRELKLSIMELTGEHNCYVTSLQVTGGGCRVKNINAYLTQELEIPCNYYDPFQNIAGVSFEKTPAVVTSSGIALGLAIEGIKKGKNPPVNFRKGDFGLKNLTLEVFWQKWSYTAKLIMAGLAAFCVFSIFKDSFALKIATTAEERLIAIAKNFIIKKKVSSRDINNYINENKKAIDASKKMAGLLEMSSALDVIKKVSESLPEKAIDILRLEIENQIFIIEGTVKRQDQISKIENGLKAAAHDAKFKKTSPEVAKGPLAFAYQINVDRNIKAPK